MADVMEQARTVHEQSPCCSHGYADCRTVDLVDAALRDRERETVRKVARLFCEDCEAGYEFKRDHHGRLWHHDGCGGLGLCKSDWLWSRWPDYVPKAEGRE